jgi:hypothetical protein
VNTGEFLTLVLSGIVVNLTGVAVAAWFSHRRLRAHLDRVTAGQTREIATLTSQQTGVIEDMTDQQTAQLLKRRWWQRRA